MLMVPEREATVEINLLSVSTELTHQILYTTTHLFVLLHHILHSFDCVYDRAMVPASKCLPYFLQWMMC